MHPLSCNESSVNSVHAKFDSGRCRRDGKEAHCHVLLNESDVTRLRSYAHAVIHDLALTPDAFTVHQQHEAVQFEY